MTECSNCLMNSQVDPHIIYNSDGVCNYCLTYFRHKKISEKLIKEDHFNKQIKSIKNSKKGKYDCILGISAGTDSSYVAHLLKREGLNVLMVHCDNAWDSDLAVSNLNKIKRSTGFDLEIRGMDSQAFYSVQRSFIKARVVDIELLSDHVNMASIYEAAFKHHIPWIVTGENINTELVMPEQWVHNKNDWKQIKQINHLFGQADLSSFPKLGPYKKFMIDKFLGIKYFKPLNSINYNKVEASETLKNEFDWKPYGGKHFESVFTIFFQCYILPEYFNIDKRFAHFSNLICSGILSKKEAKKEISKAIIDEGELDFIKKTVFDKLKVSEDELKSIMKKPIRSHSSFKKYMVHNSRIQKFVQHSKIREGLHL